MQQESDEVLARRVQAGDIDAFATLVPLFSFGAGIALLTGVVLVATALGQRLRIYVDDHAEQPLLDLCIGMLAVMLLALIPVAGTFLFVGFGVIGIGTLLHTRLGTL